MITTIKLKRNPYYMPNSKQQDEIDRLDAVARVKYEAPTIHNNDLEIHPVKIRRRRRRRK